MLACARIGAPHTVVFGGFSAEALARPHQRREGEGRDHRRRRLAARRRSCRSRRTSTRRSQGTDGREGARRRSAARTTVAMKDGPRRVVARRRRHGAGRARGARRSTASTRCSSLYTSGTTGKPKGILHTTGGYLTGAYYTTKLVFDLTRRRRLLVHRRHRLGHRAQLRRLRAARERRDGADVRGRAEPAGARSVLGDHREVGRDGVLHGADGDPRVHAVGRRVAGEARPVVAAPARLGRRADQSRGVDVVPRAIGGDRCPIVDTWWQTETGAIMISPLPGATPTKPGSATRPLPGIAADVVHKDGTPCERERGRLPRDQEAVAVDAAHDLRRPRALREDVLQRGRRAATSRATARASDEDGYFWVMGRVDDVINVAGHRLSTMEVESALVSHPKVAEAAVVGRPDELKGQAIVAFVTPRPGRRRRRRARQGAARARREGDRRARAARGDPVRRGAAEDALAARSCGACCARSRAGRRRAATRRRSRIRACSSGSRRASRPKSSYSRVVERRGRRRAWSRRTALPAASTVELGVRLRLGDLVGHARGFSSSSGQGRRRGRAELDRRAARHRRRLRGRA